jgi:hypothetical protein
MSSKIGAFYTQRQELMAKIVTIAPNAGEHKDIRIVRQATKAEPGDEAPGAIRSQPGQILFRPVRELSRHSGALLIRNSLS